MSWMLAVPLVPPVPPVPLVMSFVLLDVPLVTLVLLDVPFWRKHSGSFAAIGRTAKMRSMVVVCLVFNLAAGAQHPASEKGPTVAAGKYLALFRSVLLNLHYRVTLRSGLAAEEMGVKNTKGPCRSAGGASL